MLYDYAIVGTGAAGLHLALAMASEPYFTDKRILLIDKSDKTTNDKTWCFWERGEGKWEDIVYKSWDHGLFKYQNTVHLNLSPYRYKMIRAADFYNYAKEVLQTKSNFEWITDNVNTLTEDSGVKISTDNHAFRASLVFDSRIDSGYQQSNKYNNILQHFKGWFIKTETPIFDTNTFTMMDFSLQWKQSTSFTYILPITDREAIVEFTLFTPYLIEDISYDAMLNKYIEENLKIDNYEVNHVEKGIIPMTDYPFHENSSQQIMKIGTAGSWVKPSSGYSFKNAEKNSQRLVKLLKNNKHLPNVFSKKRFRFYDSLFLDVLNKNNHLGPEIFNAMYRYNKPPQILKFLDEETSVFEEVKLIASLPKKPFLKALKGKF